MPLQATSGAASYDAFGGGVPVVPTFIEDVYSTYVYTGVSGSNVTINNGINLSVNGGLIWSKGRNEANPHSLTDTVRGVANGLNSGSIFSGLSSGISSFTSTGYVTNQAGSTNGSSSETYVSWTLRKQSKFFDIQTWTGSGANRNISHNLGSVPGCIMVKCLNDDLAWAVYHRSLANTEYLVLNSTAAKATGATWWNSTTPTSTVFSLGTDTTVNGSAKTYVAYLFAHDAGGFGLTGTDNVISCGSYTGNGSTTGPVITLGYEPQWLMVKKSSGAGDWVMLDNMRGIVTDGIDPRVWANLSSAENTGDFLFKLNATGFQPESLSDSINASSQTYIYIAIRRGPMKVPTSGTSVFTSVARTGNRAAGSLTGIGFNPDSLITLVKSGGYQHEWNNKLAGSYQYLRPTTNESEFTSTDLKSYDQDGISFNATDFNSNINRISPLIQYFLKRAPSVFDIVCYTGTAANRTVSHNLSVVPELMIVKQRSASGENWNVYSATLTATKYLTLNLTNAEATDSLRWNDTAPTSSVFSLGTRATVNGNGTTFVAYLFSTCAGVSKVGSYTGTGALQTVNCGFTGGARFVLIKRTDSTGSWWLYDSTRGISSSDDPYLFLNSNAAEVTNTNYVDTDSTGFKVTAAAPADLNSSGGTYIFLAIA